MASQWPPKKNVAFTLSFTLYKNDGTIVANPGTYTKKVSIDGGAVADITASVTEEDTTYGQLSLVLANTEMNGDWIWVYITDNTTGTVPFTCTLYTAANTQDEIGTDVAAIHTHINDIHDTDLPAVKTDTGAIKTQTDKMAFTVANQIDANALKIGGTTQTGRDIGASVLVGDKTGFSLSATGLDLILHGATFMVALATAVWELAARTITGGTITTNSDKTGYTASTVSDKTGYTVSTVSDKTGYALSSTGADLILKSSTFIQAIVAAVNEFATYGLTALNTLLVTTGIKAATIPAATLAASQHVIVDSGTVTTLTNAPSDSSGVTTLLTRLSAARAGYLDLLNTYLDSATSAIKTVVDAIKVVTDKFRFTVTNQVDSNALSGGGGLDAAGVRGAVGLASANLDTQLAALPTDADVNAACDTAISDAAIPAALATAHGAGSWLTATGFSTHSAADVWAVSVRTLSSFGTLVADIATAVWGAATRTLSAFGFTVAITPPTDMALNSTVAKEATLTTKIPTALSFTGANVNAESKVTAAPSGMALDSTVAKDSTVMKTTSYTAPPTVDQIHDEVVEGSLSFRKIMKILLSFAAGKSTGGGTATIIFKDNADTKARITATTDTDGNRTSITLDGD
jgi:hypothetical protein